MLDLLCCLYFLAGSYPLSLAWRANRRTSLLHTLVWASAAWAGWGLTLLAVLFEPGFLPLVRHAALALTACAGIAVLGARRPGMAAWNFVVLGLLVVFLALASE